MLQKGISLLAFMCCLALPMLAHATVWQLGTTVNNAGGNLVVRNGTPQTAGNGTIFKSYTTHANIPITVNANTGYQISTVKINSVAQPLPIASGTVFQMNVANGLSQTFSANFAAQQLQVSASAGQGGSVSPA